MLGDKIRPVTSFHDIILYYTLTNTHAQGFSDYSDACVMPNALPVQYLSSVLRTVPLRLSFSRYCTIGPLPVVRE